MSAPWRFELDELRFLFDPYITLRDKAGTVYASNGIPLWVMLRDSNTRYYVGGGGSHVQFAAMLDGVAKPCTCSYAEVVAKMVAVGIHSVSCMWKTQMDMSMLYILLDDGSITGASICLTGNETRLLSIKMEASDSPRVRAYKRKQLSRGQQVYQRERQISDTTHAWMTFITYECTGDHLLPGG